MNSLVVYESFYGNTEKIARYIAQGLQDGNAVKLKKAKDLQLQDLKEVDLLVMGSATRGFSPCPDTVAIFNKLEANALKNIKIAAFDTRIGLADIKSSFFRIIVRTGGYAAPKIAKRLRQKGGKLVTEPEGFLVTEKEGPLKAGELERAFDWGKHLKHVASETVPEEAE